MQLSSPAAVPRPSAKDQASKADTERLLVVMVPAYNEVGKY